VIEDTHLRSVDTHQTAHICPWFPIKTSKSATGYVTTCTNIFRQSKGKLTLQTIKIKKSRPISRIGGGLRGSRKEYGPPVRRRWASRDNTVAILVVECEKNGVKIDEKYLRK
jgi:hypothetical protein